MLALRPYQADGISAGKRLISQGIVSILFVAATGAGKTVCFSTITEGAIRKLSRVVIIAPRREIVRQTYIKLIQSGLAPEQIGVQLGGVRTHRHVKSDDPWVAHARRRPKAPIQLGTLPSFARRDWITHNNAPDILIIDEAHQALAKSYVTFVAKCRENNPKMLVLGFTATPWRGDGKGLDAMFDRLVTIAKPHELAEWIDPATGCPYLMRPRVFTVPPDQMADTSHIKIKKNADGLLDYDQKALEEESSKPKLIGSIVENWKLRATGIRTVCFAVSVAHSKKIVERFVAEGVPAEHLDGDMTSVDRDAVLGRLASGETLVVCNCNVLTEGFDLPILGCIILARKTESLALGIQMIGRGLRYHPEKDRPVVLDHAGFIEYHGGPMMDREYSLEAPPKRKRDQKMGKTCQSCLAVVDLGVMICPECGEPFPVRVVATDLDETTQLLVEVADDTPARKKLEEHEAMRIAFEEENERLLQAGKRPRKAGALDHEWFNKYHSYPPRGHKKPKLTPEQTAAIEIIDELKLMKKLERTGQL